MFVIGMLLIMALILFAPEIGSIIGTRIAERSDDF